MIGYRSDEELPRAATALREVHHRMKNDMNLVRSLLSIQAREAADGTAGEELLRAGRRVGVMSQVYDRLLSGSDMTRMELCPFVEEIAADLRDGGCCRASTSGPSAVR